MGSARDWTCSLLGAKQILYGLGHISSSRSGGGGYHVSSFSILDVSPVSVTFFANILTHLPSHVSTTSSCIFSLTCLLMSLPHLAALSGRLFCCLFGFTGASCLQRFHCPLLTDFFLCCRKRVEDRGEGWIGGGETPWHWVTTPTSLRCSYLVAGLRTWQSIHVWHPRSITLCFESILTVFGLLHI